jgi:hypothetical protein
MKGRADKSHIEGSGKTITGIQRAGETADMNGGNPQAQVQRANHFSFAARANN